MFRANRLLPTLLVAIILLFATKLGAIWHEAGVALADTGQKPAPAAAAPAAGDKPAVTAPVDANAQPASVKPASPGAAKPPEHFTPAEVELLQELAKRRTEIEQKGDDLDKRELLLKATEQRVDEKIARLQQMQTAVDAAVGTLDDQQEQHIASLVHIYENMKPADAARIFEGMDMPALLQLISRMKDLKTAPILAAMAPEKARAVTIAMAQRKDVPEIRAN